MKNNEKRYFLKNSNLLAEIHASKLTYCCYQTPEYGNYDIICKDYKLITPNVLKTFFEKQPDRDYIIIRVMTDEHVLDYCTFKNGKLNLQDLKMKPFKHYLLKKEDFEKVCTESGHNMDEIEVLNNHIFDLKEEKKDVNRNIRLNKLNKKKQEPFKLRKDEIDKEIKENFEKIKSLTSDFYENIKKYLTEVLRSHWSGETIESGHYDVSQGRLTDGLVYMIMMLVEQYAKSGNWSGYTYIDDMKGSALVQLYDVALKFEESEGLNAFAYMTQCVSNKFTAILNGEKNLSRIKSVIMQSIGYNPTFGEQTNATFKNVFYDEDGNEMEMEDIDEPEDMNDSDNEETED